MEIETRVGGILIRKNKVLLVLHERESHRYWVIPGGHLRFGETLHQCLRREFIEEMNMEVEPAEFLFLDEHIDKQRKRHVINLIFRVHSDSQPRLNADDRLKDCAFFEKKTLNKTEVRPHFAKEKILEMLR